MSEVTYYLALPFVAGDDGIVAGEPTGCFNPNAAVMRAEAQIGMGDIDWSCGGNTAGATVPDAMPAAPRRRAQAHRASRRSQPLPA